MNGSLGLPILLGGVGTVEVEEDVIASKEICRVTVDELTIVVHLNGLNGEVKLCTHEGDKVGEDG